MNQVFFPEKIDQILPGYFNQRPQELGASTTNVLLSRLNNIEVLINRFE